MKTIETNVLETITGGLTSNPDPQPLTPEQKAANRIAVTLPPNADVLRVALRTNLRVGILADQLLRGSLPR
jgi:hypothetical protein